MRNQTKLEKLNKKIGRLKKYIYIYWETNIGEIKQNFEKFGIEIWYQTEVKQKAIHQKQNHKYNANKYFFYALIYFKIQTCSDTSFEIYLDTS